MKDRRIGRFFIDAYVIDRDPQGARAILKDVIVVRAEQMWNRNGVEYVGICDAFEVNDPMHMVPEYEPQLVFSRDAAVQVTWKRISA